MPSRWSRAALHTTALLVVVALAPCDSSEARPVRGLRLDEDVPRAEVVVVAKILSSVFQRNARWMERRGQTVMPVPANAGFAVDEHEVTAKVLLRIKGAYKQGASLTFRHRHESATGLMVNGFGSHEFKLGDTYLLVLVKEPDKVLAVSAPEQWFYPTFPDALVTTLPTAPHAASVLVHVYRVLLARFEYGKAADSVGVQCAELLTHTKASRAWLKIGSQQAQVVARLKPLTDVWLGTDRHGTVLHVLRELGAPIGAKRTLTWILNTALSASFRVNLLHNLYASPPEEHLAAIDAIMASGTDRAVVTAAAYARRYAAKRVSAAEAAARRKREDEEARKAREEAGKQRRGK